MKWTNLQREIYARIGIEVEVIRGMVCVDTVPVISSKAPIAQIAAVVLEYVMSYEDI